MRNKDGQVSFSTDKERKIYEDMKCLCKHGMDLSGNFWNWPLTGYASYKSLQRILNLAWIYDLQKKSSGSILEFGVHSGSSFIHLMNLRTIHEPYNLSRHIYGFDTFNGFVNTSKKDKNSKEGDFKITENYDEHLEKLCNYHEALAPNNHIKKFSLFKGDAKDSLSLLLKNNPELVISLVIFDMDIYKPTKDVLSLLKNRLHKGSIIVFDELNCSEFPGETIAAMEELNFRDIELIQSPYLSFNSVCKFV